MNEYWTTFRHLSPAKIKAAKSFLKANNIEIIDFGVDAAILGARLPALVQSPVPQSSRGKLFRHKFEILTRSNPATEVESFGDHPWRTETLFVKRKPTVNSRTRHTQMQFV